MVIGLIKKVSGEVRDTFRQFAIKHRLRVYSVDLPRQNSFNVYHHHDMFQWRIIESSLKHSQIMHTRPVSCLFEQI